MITIADTTPLLLVVREWSETSGISRPAREGHSVPVSSEVSCVSSVRICWR